MYSRANARRARSSCGVSKRIYFDAVIAGHADLGCLSLLGLLGLIILRLNRLRRGVSVKERLVILLSLDEGILEGVGVWEMSVACWNLGMVCDRGTHSQSWRIE